MAIYRTVSMSFWTDSKVVDDFSPEDRYFYLYLFTNPHTNLCGCYEISMKQMSVETGYTVDIINILLERFETTHNIIRYSSKTKELLLLNWHKYNWTASEKFRKPLDKEIQNVKQPEFKEYLRKIFDGENNGYPIDTKCIDTSVTVTDTVSVTDADYSSVKPNDETAFDQFWEAYPKKVGKKDARKAFDKAIKTVDLDTILQAIEVQKGSDQWSRDNGKYIPNPSTWLNHGRWDDELAPKRYSPLYSETFDNDAYWDSIVVSEELIP